jgi:MFS family permease
VAAISFGMLGLFLPLVIYLQSVLGLTALQAGLTLAPMSVISMFVAPVAGRLSDKFGGKWILFTGLTLWTVGLSIVLASAHPDSSRWHLLPGLLVAGFGLGMTFAPLQTIAMLNVNPRMAGAASGMITTTRQLGAVIGSAAVGALLQAQLSEKLPAAAAANAAALPEQFRNQFIEGFGNAAAKGLEVGAGQTGAALPSGLPAQIVQTITAVAQKTFHEGFTAAMRITLVLPLIVLGIAALAVLLVRRKPVDARAEPDHAGMAAG